MFSQAIVGLHAWFTNEHSCLPWITKDDLERLKYKLLFDELLLHITSNTNPNEVYQFKFPENYHDEWSSIKDKIVQVKSEFENPKDPESNETTFIEWIKINSCESWVLWTSQGRNEDKET